MRRFTMDQVLTRTLDGALGDEDLFRRLMVLAAEIGCLGEEWVPASFQELNEQFLELQFPLCEVVTQAVKCACVEDFKQNERDIVDKIKALCNGKLPTDHRAWDALRERADKMVADEYVQTKRCHGRKSIVRCFCDEHGH